MDDHFKAAQVAQFEQFLKEQGITPTYTLDGAYSGALLNSMWARWQAEHPAVGDPHRRDSDRSKRDESALHWD